MSINIFRYHLCLFNSTLFISCLLQSKLFLGALQKPKAWRQNEDQADMGGTLPLMWACGGRERGRQQGRGCSFRTPQVFSTKSRANVCITEVKKRTNFGIYSFASENDFTRVPLHPPPHLCSIFPTRGTIVFKITTFVNHLAHK